MINDFSRGIFLEDADTLLPWDFSREELGTIANPIQQESNDRFLLNWNGHVLFGGVKVQVEAVFYKENRQAHDHHNASGRLHGVNLNFPQMENLHPREQFERLKIDFIQALGAPSFEREGNSQSSDLPLAKWELPDALVVLMVFEHFFEYCVCEVRHKPRPAKIK